ncbi:hypothetical protein AMECASPLE_005697 [Ameca splendens]|uniref:Uncharacterized protein n=1 Tax=Ameca splendens TaxID=208324 RepID=A0ABV0XN74_9TELE
MFFIAFGLMNETNTIASKETEKNGHKRAAPFQFIFLGLPYILYRTKPPSTPCLNPTQSNCSVTFLSGSLPSFVPFLPTWHHIPSCRFLQSFLLFSISTHCFQQAHIQPVTYIIDTFINPGFVLWQKGVGYPSGATLIAK